MEAANAVATAEQAIPRARWFRIIPPLVIIFIIAYMDRVNIGFAMAGGMNRDLALTATGSGMAAGIFFWGYLVLQVPGGHIAEHGSAKKFIAWTILGWGGISLISGFAQSAWQMYILRFLLGVAEGGVAPAIYVIISKWFPQKELGRANSLFLISLPLSATVTNPISGWVVETWGWRGLFFFEGVVSLSLIFVWWPLISDKPEDAKWISKAEKEYLLTTLAKEKARSIEMMKAAGQAKWSYGQLLLNKNLWLMMTAYFCYLCGSLGYMIWLPSLLKKLTKMSLTNVGWLSALPLATGVAGVYLLGAMSDRKGNRRLWCSLAVMGFGIAFWASAYLSAHIWLSYALIVLAGLFSKAMMGAFWSMAPLVFPPGVAGGARGMINGVGNLGGFFGPVLIGWVATMTGSMDYGIYTLSALVIAGGFVLLLLPKVTAGYKYQEKAGAAEKLPVSAESSQVTATR